VTFHLVTVVGQLVKTLGGVNGRAWLRPGRITDSTDNRRHIYQQSLVLVLMISSEHEIPTAVLLL